MMTSIFYAIGAMFEGLFTLVKPIGPFMNGLFIVIGSIATCFWIWYMVKRQDEEKGFNH